MRRALSFRSLLLWAAPLVSLSCGGDGGTDISVPSLTITTATSGVELDPDGYAVAVDGSPAQPIGLDANVTIDQLTDGQHTVTLSGLAANCTTGTNPETVTVSAGSTATAAFGVTCRPLSGSIVASTTVSGSGSDPDGFELTVDGTEGASIGANGSVTLSQISAGAHLLGLTGLAANCLVTGDNPVAVTVGPGQAANASFAITCSTPPPNTGTLQITTATGGSNPDPDGYGVSIDGGTAQPIGTSATLNLLNVAAGLHTVQLGGVASNCSVSEANPQVITVVAGSTAAASFTLTCIAPPPGTGSIQVTASTTGDSQDDSYAVSVDGVSQQALTADGTITINNLIPGSHAVELAGVAPNCTVADVNPRAITVAAGQTATVSFAVSCVTPQPTNGSIAVTASTTGSSLDPDGYRFTIDNGSSRAIGVNGRQTVQNVTPGPHSVRLTEVAANCTVSGDNPRSITITAAQTAAVGFTITCVTPPPTTGSIVVTASTSGSSLDPDGYRFAIDNGSTRPLAINGNQTVQDIAPGNHSVRLSDLAPNCTASGANPRSVTVTAGQAATAAFSVSCVAPSPTVNLSIRNLYLTQSTQTLTGAVPLVANRAAFLRVFVVANQSNTAKPVVKVTLRRGGTSSERTINAPSGGVPTSVEEGALGSSWNLALDASLIQPGLSISAEVDPGNLIPESNENDNAFPASGSPQVLTIRTVAPAKIRFVPIQQGDAAPGNITNGNKDAVVALTRKIYPLGEIDTDIHDVYSVPAGMLQANGTGWGQLLTDLDGIRVAEGTDRTYFGIANLDYQFGLVGATLPTTTTSAGTDSPIEIQRVIAHELGHTWNQLHTPCGNPKDVDPNYPYGLGIGVYGFDVAARTLRPPSTPDIMGYCPNPWISDYIYTRVMNFRALSPVVAQVVSPGKEPTLLVWGRIVNGQVMLEPTFHLVTRPQLPSQPGPYSLEATSIDGSVLFRFSFDPVEVADVPGGERHFAFAVPLSQAQAARLGSVRVDGPGGAATASAELARLPGGAAPDSAIAVHRNGPGVDLEWDPSAHRMIMVRDAATGEVLSFARGGRARVKTTTGALELVASDGVHSRTLRVNPR